MRVKNVIYLTVDAETKKMIRGSSEMRWTKNKDEEVEQIIIWKHEKRET